MDNCECVIHKEVYKDTIIVIHFYDEWFNGYFKVSDEQKPLVRPYINSGNAGWTDFWRGEEWAGWSASHHDMVCEYKGKRYGPGLTGLASKPDEVTVYTLESVIEETKKQYDAFCKYAIQERRKLSDIMFLEYGVPFCNDLITAILEHTCKLYGGDV